MNNKGMNVTQLVLMPTGTYDNMVMRPYEVVDNIRGLQRLQEVSEGGRNLTPENLSGVSGSILRPSTGHLGTVDIANGWGQRRCRYVLRVTTQDPDGSSRDQIITGFTDHDGVNLATGSIYHNMRFHINNSITMRNIQVVRSYGAVAGQGIAKADQVFFRTFQPGMEDVANRSDHLMRPKDVFTTLQTQEYLRSADHTLDPRAGFGMEHLKMSKRSNVVAPKYMSELLQAGASSFQSSDFADNQSRIWSGAEGLASESIYTADPVIFNINRMTSFQEGGSFTFGELMAMCPHLYSVTQVAQPQDMVRGEVAGPVLPPYQQGMNDGWNGQNYETVWATVLSHSVPTLMMECVLANVGFRAHNHTYDNSVVVDFWYAQPFGQNLDGIALSENFRYRLIHLALRDLIGDNPASFEIEGHFDILGESRLTISINGGTPVPFATPTFADALFSPILTQGQNRVRELSQHMGFFTENLLNTEVNASPRALSTASAFHTAAAANLFQPAAPVAPTTKSWMA